MASGTSVYAGAGRVFDIRKPWGGGMSMEAYDGYLEYIVRMSQPAEFFDPITDNYVIESLSSLRNSDQRRVLRQDLVYFRRKPLKIWNGTNREVMKSCLG